MIRNTIVAAAAVAMLGAFGSTLAETRAEAKVDNAAHATASATRHAAQRTTKGTRHVAHKSAKATRHTAHRTAHATRHSTHKVAHAPHQRAHPAMNRTMHEAPDFRAATSREERMSEAHARWERSRKL